MLLVEALERFHTKAHFWFLWKFATAMHHPHHLNTLICNCCAGASDPKHIGTYNQLSHIVQQYFKHRGSPLQNFKQFLCLENCFESFITSEISTPLSTHHPQHVPTFFLNLAASALMVLVKCWHLEQTFIASNLNVFTVKCINKEQNNKSRPKVNLAAGELLLVTLPRVQVSFRNACIQPFIWTIGTPSEGSDINTKITWGMRVYST